MPQKPAVASELVRVWEEDVDVPSWGGPERLTGSNTEAQAQNGSTTWQHVGWMCKEHAPGTKPAPELTTGHTGQVI